jgi:hypothetical protein
MKTRTASTSIKTVAVLACLLLTASLCSYALAGDGLGSAPVVLIDANPIHGPGPLPYLWRPGIVWEGGGGGGNNVNPTLVKYWAGLGGFDRIGLVRIVPELDSIARGAYSLADFAPLVEQVKAHDGRLLVKIMTTPIKYTNTPNPPDSCPPNDPNDWHYSTRYNKYGIDPSEEETYKALIKDFIRYFSAKGGSVVNPELFGDNSGHPTLGMPNVLYELWDEPNYDMKWCDTEENFWHLYQLITEAARDVRKEGALPFTIGGPGWRKKTLRDPALSPGFGAPLCLDADDPDCGAVRRFYDFLYSQGLENGHISWWSYSFLPTEVTEGVTKRQLENIRAILSDPGYQGSYSNTLIVLGEWAPPFGDGFIDLLPAKAWRDEYGEFFGKNINDDNEVGASLVPARIWDMTRASPPPALQSYFPMGEWPVNDFLSLFKGTTGVITSQSTGLLKAISNVFLMLNRLQPQQLAIQYPQNPMLNLVATASDDGAKLAVLGWYHPSIKDYEKNGVVTYDKLLADLEQGGIKPVTVTLNFKGLKPGATYKKTVFIVDKDHSNSFSYRHAVAEQLFDDCGSNSEAWKRACVYRCISQINTWRLDGPGPGASVALESASSTFTADVDGSGNVILTMAPYSVLLVTLDKE